MTQRSHLNSGTIGGKNIENAVHALTPVAMVTKAPPTTTRP